jgi:hypothetical protein
MERNKNGVRTDRHASAKSDPTPDQVEHLAREMCQQAGLDPDWMALDGWDKFDAIRNPNWTIFAEQAEDDLRLKEAFMSEGGLSRE